MSAQRFATPQPVRVEVHLPIGDLQIATVDGGESIVALKGTSKLVDAIKVELVGDRLLIVMRRRTFSDFFGRFDGSLQLKASIPHQSQVEIVTAAADAKLDGSFAGVAAKSASGDVHVTGDIAGTVNAKTVSGDVRLPHIGGDLTVRTVSGNADAAAVDGSVSARTVSGNVRVASVREGRVDVQSVSGSVELGVAHGTRVDVDAASASGELSSEVPLSDAPGAGTGPTVVVRGNTASGDFRLVRAA